MTTTPPAATLSIQDDAAPCPRVEITISPMPNDADTIIVYRNTSSGKVPVRGAQGVTVSGDLFVVDYEAPFGVNLFYTSITTDSDGNQSVESPPSDGVGLDSDIVWFSDPVSPTDSMELSFRGPVIIRDGQPIDVPFNLVGGFGSFDFAAGDLATNNVVGGSLPVAMMGVIQEASNIAMSWYCKTNAAATQLRELIKLAFPLCVRVAYARVPQLNGLAYFALTNVTETRVVPGEGSTFTFTAQSVAPPASGIIINPRSWDDIYNVVNGGEAATWDDLATLYPTWAAVERG